MTASALSVETCDSLIVERGKIREFMSSLGSTDVVHRSVDAARKAGFPDIPAPPTFSRCYGFFEPRLGSLLGLDPSRVVVGGYRWDCSGTLVAGRSYQVSRSEVERTLKQGRRGGQMELYTVTTSLSEDPRGQVLAERMTIIHSQVAVGDSARERDSRPAGSGDESGPLPDPPPIRTVVLGPITSEDCARYAGATGQFNPVHYDLGAAHAAGMAAILVPGVYIGSVLLNWMITVGSLAGLETVEMRFRHAVWGGETLRLNVGPLTQDPHIEGETQSGWAVNGQGIVVATVEATYGTISRSL